MAADAAASGEAAQSAARTIADRIAPLRGEFEDVTVSMSTVELERREDGKRLGLATGTGVGFPDRSSERTAAAFAPGLLGAAVAHDSLQPKPGKDAIIIEQAVLRALDNALLQLAAYWGNEQFQRKMMEEARSKGRKKK